MLTLYTYWRSSCSYRVRIALAIKNLPYEPRFVHLLKGGGEQHMQEYRVLNPEGRVPLLLHDGAVFSQSLSIMEYLDERFPAPPLLPSGMAARARVRGLAQLIASDMQPLQNAGTASYLREVLRLEKSAVEGWLLDWISRGLHVLETRLARESGTGTYMHGDQPTIADCCLVPQCYAARRFGVDVSKFRTIARIEAACLDLEPFIVAAPEKQPDAPSNS